jgi:hypothetical protein
MYRQHIGATLYQHVVDYAAIGDHHTGTDADASARRWLRGELTARGARVEEQPYRFERYAASARVTARERALRALPLFYGGVGAVDAADPPVVPVGFGAGQPEIDVDDLVGRTATATRASALVLATGGDDGRLVAVNRAPVSRPDTPLVALVAGAEINAAARRRERLRVEIDAELVAGESATVVARLGPEAADPYVVTTPLTGWFACAGERGTGIAVAIEVATRLAARHPVLVVATTGHELGFLGLRDYLARSCLRPRAVLHLGAGVAAGDPEADGTVALHPLRAAFTTLARCDRVARALEPARYSVVEMKGPWPGEGQDWRHLGVPVLSLVAGFARFHTPDDVPAAVTSPALLARVCDAVSAAADLLVA